MPVLSKLHNVLPTLFAILQILAHFSNAADDESEIDAAASSNSYGPIPSTNAKSTGSVTKFGLFSNLIHKNGLPNGNFEFGVY